MSDLSHATVALGGPGGAPTKITPNQALARALLAACLVMAFLSFVTSATLASFELMVLARFGKTRPPSDWAAGIYVIARAVPPACLVIACILGLLRTRRSRGWVRAATVLFVVRELAHFGRFAHVVLTSLPLDDASYFLVSGLWLVTSTLVATIVAVALFLQVGLPEVTPWLAQSPAG